jgi:glutaconate CoA-transferase subunit B
MAAFSFDRDKRRFRLESVHPGFDAAAVVAATGFNFECPDQVPETPAPSDEMLDLIRGPLVPEIAETYPKFAAKVFNHPETVAS